jgi:hypothetical protein
MYSSQWPPRQASDLVRIEGVLTDYSFIDGGDQFVAALTIAGQTGRFWTPAVPMRSGPAPFVKGSRVRLFADAVSPSPPLDGDARKAYGLWVDARSLETVEAALDAERRSRRWLAGIGLAFVSLGTLMHWRQRKQHRFERRQP